GPEPAWHRRQRSKRAAARVLLRVLVAASTLAEHHSTMAPEQPAGQRQHSNWQEDTPADRRRRSRRPTGTAAATAGQQAPQPQQQSGFTEKQRAVLDMVLPMSYEEAQGHESWSSPPPDPEMLEVWRRTRSQRLARLADNIAGARSAGAALDNMGYEAAATAENITLVIPPKERLRQPRSTLELAEEELASLQARIAAQLDEEAQATKVARIYRVLIRETKDMMARTAASGPPSESEEAAKLRSREQAMAQKTLRAVSEQLERQQRGHEREVEAVRSAAHRELEHEQAACRKWQSGNKQHQQEEAGAALQQLQRHLATQAQEALQGQKRSSEQETRAMMEAANRARRGEGQRLQLARQERERRHRTRAELESEALALAQQARASEARRAVELGHQEARAGQEMMAAHLELQTRQAAMGAHHSQQERRLVAFGMEQAEAHQQGKRRLEEGAWQALAGVRRPSEEHRASNRRLEQQAEQAPRDAFQHLQWVHHDNARMHWELQARHEQETAALRSALRHALGEFWMTGDAPELGAGGELNPSPLSVE
ncbi:unnamed protein product, partial [Prorocentrum cordatum]